MSLSKMVNIFKFDPSIQYYKNRAGEKVGPVTLYSYDKDFLCLYDNPLWFSSTYKFGQFAGRKSTKIENEGDLVDVWSEEIDTKLTQTQFNDPFEEPEIVIEDNVLEYSSIVKSGDYGIVRIDNDLDGDYEVSLNASYPDAESLRHAAKVFIELANFLDSQG